MFCGGVSLCAEGMCWSVPGMTHRSVHPAFRGRLKWWFLKDWPARFLPVSRGKIHESKIKTSVRKHFWFRQQISIGCPTCLSFQLPHNRGSAVDRARCACSIRGNLGRASEDLGWFEIGHPQKSYGESTEIWTYPQGSGSRLWYINIELTYITIYCHTLLHRFFRGSWMMAYQPKMLGIRQRFQVIWPEQIRELRKNSIRISICCLYPPIFYPQCIYIYIYTHTQNNVM